MIHNLLVPICKNCTHFTGTLNTAKFGINKCKLFGAKDLVSGKIIYENAYACRRSSEKCKIDASLFVPKQSVKMDNNNVEHSYASIYRDSYFRDTSYRVLDKYPFFDKTMDKWM